MWASCPTALLRAATVLSTSCSACEGTYHGMACSNWGDSSVSEAAPPLPACGMRHQGSRVQCSAPFTSQTSVCTETSLGVPASLPILPPRRQPPSHLHPRRAQPRVSPADPPLAQHASAAPGGRADAAPRLLAPARRGRRRSTEHFPSTGHPPPSAPCSCRLRRHGSHWRRSRSAVSAGACAGMHRPAAGPGRQVRAAGCVAPRGAALAQPGLSRGAASPCYVAAG